MNDIEEDPELRANINLYKVSFLSLNFSKNESVIDELEKQLAGLKIETEPKKSPIGEALDKGSATIAGQERKLVKAARKTTKGKQNSEVSESQRIKDKELFKATLKKDDDSDWESVEEDFPHVKLEELLANLKLDDGPKVEHSDEEESKE